MRSTSRSARRRARSRGFAEGLRLVLTDTAALLPTTAAGFTAVNSAWHSGGWGVRNRQFFEADGRGPSMPRSRDREPRGNRGRLRHCEGLRAPTATGGADFREGGSKVRGLESGYRFDRARRAGEERVWPHFAGQLLRQGKDEARARTGFEPPGGTRVVAALVSCSWHLPDRGPAHPSIRAHALPC